MGPLLSSSQVVEFTRLDRAGGNLPAISCLHPCIGVQENTVVDNDGTLALVHRAHQFASCSSGLPACLKCSSAPHSVRRVVLRRCVVPPVSHPRCHQQDVFLASLSSAVHHALPGRELRRIWRYAPQDYLLARAAAIGSNATIFKSGYSWFWIAFEFKYIR